MKRFLLLALMTSLIVYGSLYPFVWAPAAPAAFARLFSNWQPKTSMGDLLGNIGLFFPWGFVAMLTLVPRWGLRGAVPACVLSGLTLALGVQVLQIWVPSRNPALADVFWNLVGMVVGAVPGAYLALRRGTGTVQEQVALVPVFLLCGFILTEWLPLIPSIDLQLVKEQLKSLWTAPTLSWLILWQRFAMALLAGHLLTTILDDRKSRHLLPLLLAGVTMGKLFLRDVQMDASVPLSFALAVVCWWGLLRLERLQRAHVIWLLLLTSYTAGALAPFALRDHATDVNWLPFAALLEGAMLGNVRAVIGNLVVFAGILYVGGSTARTHLMASIGLALWVVLMELMQTLIETRVSDMTEPLLILLLGKLLSYAARLGVRHTPLPAATHRSTLPRSAPALAPQTGRNLQSLVMQIMLATTVIVLGMAVVLRLPGIPYNVTELFRADGRVPALFSVALALLWAGGGAVWLGTRLAQTSWPGLLLPPMTLLVSLASLTLLWLGVTTESIEDISGSSNVFWWVTNRDTWGVFWRQVFLYLDAPGVISFLEHSVRYSALYAPLPMTLGLMVIARDTTERRGQRFDRKGRLAGLLVSALAIFWACKAIAFDWASTDNLNELIAAEGEWGWGGGGFLYGLLALLCATSLFMATACRAPWHQRVTGFALYLAGLPLGWWLLNQGLEQQVHKYGHVFSSVQFLLGPDRHHLLSPEVLFLRWCAVQTVAVVTLATGIRLGQAACRMTAYVSTQGAKAC